MNPRPGSSRGFGTDCGADLDTLGTHPDYQRRGAGSLAVKWGCDMADKDGVSAYVDANKEGAGLYKKFGFLDYSQPGAVIASMARGKTGL